ncbi:MAG: molybdate ABC transporter permease subunit [Deltaproteobacteria bacterium]|nr:molybdate ABC transporter permease subunit [Deltaproteobacteria bacterium]
MILAATTPFDPAPLWLSVRLAAVTTSILLLLGVPLAALIARGRFRGRAVLATFVSLPLVLPPSVLGFYLLVAFSPSRPFGALIERVFDCRLAFSFTGLVIGSVLYSLPFMVHPIQAGLEALPPSLAEASYTLGKGRFTTLLRVLLPNIRPSLLTGIVLSFAHTLGEFGVVLMIGGNIPGVTRVAALAIYDEVETMHYAAAHTYAAILFGVSFCILLAVHMINGRFLKESVR